MGRRAQVFLRSELRELTVEKIKDGFKLVWELLLDGIDIVSGLIERFPKTTLALIVCYLLVRR